ncbi:MAG: sodium/proline symporter [Acidobacteriota bacterium]|nr:sodium/proline symporter [Acidobacteriota bacterium]MDQ7088857.1 sodium/proline symporter [Acidobacteriota bacterium]
MTAKPAIAVTLVLYALALLVLGWWGRRKTRDTTDFFLGGRRLGPLVAAISASASSSSAWTLLSVSGAAYCWGLSAAWLFPACVGGFALNWFLLAPALQRQARASGALTVTQVLAGPSHRPGSRTISLCASLIVLFSFTVYVASQFLGAAKTFASTFGLSTDTSLLLGSTVVVLYTMAGGFWAVSLTDTLQGLLMAAVAILLPAAALVAVGGPIELWQAMGRVEEIRDAGRLVGAGPAVFLSPTRALGPAALGLVLGLLGIGLGYPGQPHVVNRFMALAGDHRTLEHSRRMAMGWALTVYGGMLLTGWCGRVLLAPLADQEVVFIALTRHLFPPVMAGVMLAAVLSAIMSTADSQLLVAGSSVTVDLGLAGRRRVLLHSRLVVILLSTMAVGLAHFGSRQIFAPVLFAWSALGAAFGPLLLVTALRGPVPPRRTLAAMGAGFVLSVAAYSLPPFKGGAAERVFPFLVALLIALGPPGRHWLRRTRTSRILAMEADRSDLHRRNAQ